MASSPRKFIILPASIVYVLSYPFLYTLFSSGFPEISILPYRQTVNIVPDVFVKQLYISPPSFSDALSPQLLESLATFMSFFPDAGINHHDSNSHLPSSSLDKLPCLLSIIPGTTNSNNSLSLSSLPLHSPQEATLAAQMHSVLYLPRVANAKILSASGLLISYLYNDDESEQTWNDAISSLMPSVSTKSIDTFSYIVSSKKVTERKSILQLSFTVLPFCPAPLVGFTVTYSLLASYIALSWEHVSSVRSRLGLFIAGVVQILLSMSSALAIMSFFYPTFSANSLRNFLIVPYFVVVVSLENIIRLLNAVAKSPPENHPSSRLAAGLTETFPKTIKVLSSYFLFIMLYCYAFPSVSLQNHQILLFAIISLIIDLAMHVTYFSAILFVDLRRLELEDLINSDSITTPQSTSLLPFELDNKIPQAIRNQYVYLRHVYLHPRLSASTTVLVLSMIFLFIWGYITDPSEQHIYSSKKVTFFLSPLLSPSSPLSKYKNIRVFEPLVVQGDSFFPSPHPMAFRIGNDIRGSFFSFIRIFSFNILLEFLASLAFILSLTGVILKFLFPPMSEPAEPAPSSDSDVMEFFSKELTGFHTLDVLLLSSQGSTITTVSLDHKVLVWNVASAPGAKIERPIQIPNPPDFWPISKVVLNSSLNMIAIYCMKVSAIKCYNFKSGTLLYHLQDSSHFNVLPVEIFFSGPELIVTTRKGFLLSISDTGIMKTFRVEFVSKSESLRHSRRLLTPRIPERVVCVSTQNDISIGTHIGKVWKFRKLQIRESQMPINIHTHGVHDLSRYKPQVTPVPQAMLSRRPMGSARLDALNGAASHQIEKPKPKVLQNPVLEIVPVPAINMVLLATSVQACLFDAHTGIIVRRFQLGHFKPGTLRAFHSQPTHCRFCGCVSVDSVSIAYSDAEEEGMAICHTLTIDNRAKNSICIRVERDPRETRCLGFDATTERQHWIGRVEGWDTTDMNMIMGVRRKEIPSEEDISNSSQVSLIQKLRQRKFPGSEGFRNRSRRRHTTDTIFSQSTVSSSRPPIRSTWEGFAMSATGQISIYDIPDYSEHVHDNPNYYDLHQSKDLRSHQSHHSLHHIHHRGFGAELSSVSRSRLLIRSLGPVTKYGAKSIAVAFGNIIKVLYFGKEESFVNAKTDHPESRSSALRSLSYPPPSPGSGISASKKWRREVGY